LGVDALHDRPRDAGAPGDARSRPVLRNSLARLSSLLTVFVAVAAGGLAGCSDTHIVTSDDPLAPAARTADRAAVQPANAAIGERLAAAALDDSQLGGIRGGLSTGSGLVVNFSFQEATYVNHTLTQNIVVPTMTVSPGSATGAAATASGAALAPIGNLATQVQMSSPTQAIQSILNNGMTSVVSNLGGRGVTSTVSNAANNQLIQQVITANIGIVGLSQTIQQNVASTVASRLAAANSQFR
jgi:hypothetical protein